MSQRTFDNFDEYAGDYRNIHSKNIKLSGADSFYFVQMKVKLVKGYEQNDHLKILDVGCGDGATEFFFQKYFYNCQVEGIDVSEQSIKVAKAKQLSNTNFSTYNGVDIMFANETFDIVFIAGVLHHIEFTLHAQLLEQIFKVLKTGGRLYLFEHNPYNPITKHLVNTCVFDANAKLLSFKYTKKVLARTKFKIATLNFIIFFPRKKIFLKLLSLEKHLKWLPLGGQYFIRAVK